VGICHILLHASDLLAAQGVSSQSEAEVFGGPAQHIFHVYEDVVIKFIHAQVEVLELRSTEEEPLLNLLAILISCCSLLDVINDWNGLFGFFLLLEFFVFLNDQVSLFDFLLMSFNLFRSEQNFAHVS
jgi:hypothetical protein